MPFMERRGSVVFPGLTGIPRAFWNQTSDIVLFLLPVGSMTASWKGLYEQKDASSLNPSNDSMGLRYQLTIEAFPK